MFALVYSEAYLRYLILWSFIRSNERSRLDGDDIDDLLNYRAKRENSVSPSDKIRCEVFLCLKSRELSIRLYFPYKYVLMKTKNGTSFFENTKSYAKMNLRILNCKLIYGLFILNLVSKYLKAFIVMTQWKFILGYVRHWSWDRLIIIR